MRALILLCLIGSTAVSVPVPQGPQGRDGDDDFSISVNVRLVLFNVSVTDGKGRHISGLKVSDFRVVDEGQPQDIKLFSAEDVPATIGLIIDNSGSMKPKRADVLRAALTFVQNSNPYDEMFVIDFNERVHMSLPAEVSFTNNIEKVRAALLQMNPDGRTALYDAVGTAVEHLKMGTHQRKALLVLSDGGDNASLLSLPDILATAQQSNATIYTIGIYDDTDVDRNPQVLRKIAKAGGGRAFFPQSPGNMDQAWREIAGEIRSQYTIGFVPSVPGKKGILREVKIAASRNGGSPLHVSARVGYVTP